MCGILGVINLNKKPMQEGILTTMMQEQRHRGPDDIGYYLNGFIGLGHVRLSIIDLSQDAHQPMSNEDSSIFIVYNGEIYNYLELRHELQLAGHYFRSKSDTEVILHAYEQWGESCLKYFNGMWSFAILDLRKNELFCSRDRFGVKPFYYYIDNENFIFASEIKVLLRHPKIKRQPNDRSIFAYLCSGYGYMDTSDETFFKDIKQLKASHFTRLSLANGRFIQLCYWDLNPQQESKFINETEVYDNFYFFLKDAIRLRLRSDVPIGISLSGGLDSCSVAVVAATLIGDNRLETFSSCFVEEEFDERPFIRPVLDRTKANANFIFSKPDNLFVELEKIIWHQDEPYSTLSIFPQWYVMKAAKEKGIKVLLTGQGGDEVLAGYHKYYPYFFADLIYSFKWRKAYTEMTDYSKYVTDRDKIFRPIFKILLSRIVSQTLRDFVNPRIDTVFPGYLNKDFVKNNINKVRVEEKFSDILNNSLYNGVRISPLPSLLHIDDRSSMAHSIESRSPFLDYRLVEYVFSLGPEYKIRNALTKHLLRQSLRGILPEKVRLRRDKMGFTTPLAYWFRTILRDTIYGLLSSDRFLRRPYFNQEGVSSKLKDFLDGRKKNDAYTIWSWVNLELWFRKFIDESKPLQYSVG